MSWDSLGFSSSFLRSFTAPAGVVQGSRRLPWSWGCSPSQLLFRPQAEGSLGHLGAPAPLQPEGHRQFLHRSHRLRAQGKPPHLSTRPNPQPHLPPKEAPGSSSRFLSWLQPSWPVASTLCWGEKAKSETRYPAVGEECAPSPGPRKMRALQGTTK